MISFQFCLAIAFVLIATWALLVGVDVVSSRVSKRRRILSRLDGAFESV